MKTNWTINKPTIINGSLSKHSADLRDKIGKVDAEISILRDHVDQINRVDAENKLFNDALNAARSRTRRP